MGSRQPALDLLLGAAAGAVATWLMDQVTTAIQERQPKRTQDAEKEASGGTSAYVNAVKKAASLAGRELDDDTTNFAASSIHWTLGVSTGALYGLLRNRLRALGIGSGVAYGAAVWLLLDEAALTALGLAPPPQKYPWQTHARGLAGHLVFGAAIELPFDLLDLVSR